MNDYMNIKLVPILTSEFDTLFKVVKRAIYPYVDKVFGWNDAFQRRRLVEEYDPSWFYWVFTEGTCVGMLCYKPYEDKFHIHFLIIFPEFQNQGFGESVMAYVYHLAKKEGRKCITLSSFVHNVGAIKFYKRLGCRIIEKEDDFLSLALKISK